MVAAAVGCHASRYIARKLRIDTSYRLLVSSMCAHHHRRNYGRTPRLRRHRELHATNSDIASTGLLVAEGAGEDLVVVEVGAGGLEVVKVAMVATTVAKVAMKANEPVALVAEVVDASGVESECASAMEEASKYAAFLAGMMVARWLMS